MDITLKIWRQKDAKSKGRFETYPLSSVSPEMSFLEMLDYLNSQLIVKGEDPVTYEHDCREGICGSCGLYINGRPHGLHGKTTTCELYCGRPQFITIGIGMEGIRHDFFGQRTIVRKEHRAYIEIVNHVAIGHLGGNVAGFREFVAHFAGFLHTRENCQQQYFRIR